MGFTPATGQEISIGCVYTAFGLFPKPGLNIGLNSILGLNRQPPQALGVVSIPAGVNTALSVDMGGLDTIDEYCPPLVTGLIWNLTVNNPCNATPWVVTNENLKIRYNITDSLNCGGTCASLQAGTATATITVGATNVNMGLSFQGIGELEQSDYEKITFSLDGVQIANANAAGGGLQCQMGAVIQTFTQAPPYLLLANTVHTLFINFTTNDPLYHVGAFYEVDLTFV